MPTTPRVASATGRAPSDLVLDAALRLHALASALLATQPDDAEARTLLAEVEAFLRALDGGAREVS